MKDLHISMLQTNLRWEDGLGNLQSFEKKITALQKTDLIVLPEMFNSGFTMNTEAMAETMHGPTVTWMKKMAAAKKAVLIGSLIIKEEGHCYNRLIWARPDGSLDFYDKRHLFRMADEHHHFDAGNHRNIFTLNGWKICPLICYDLRFPVWSRNKFEQLDAGLMAEYDLLIYVANWPSARIDAWDLLLRARAAENQAYCIGLNRVGEDGKQINYNGHSCVIDPKGNYLEKPIANEEKSFAVSLDGNALIDFRLKFPQGLDADDFELS